jgi:hypothetical protein
MVRRTLLVCTCCFFLIAGTAGAQVSVPSLKPLSSTSAWFQVGDYSSTLRGIPSASSEYLRRARRFVHALRHQLNETVQVRDLRRRNAVRRQSRALRRELAADARDHAQGQRRKARSHYRERRREAKAIPDPQRRRAKLRRAARLFEKRKAEIQHSLDGNLREAGRAAASARAGARPRVRTLRRNDRGIAKTQNRELTYQFRALRNRS